VVRTSACWRRARAFSGNAASLPTFARSLDAYPNLTAEDLRAAMLFAADTVAHEQTAETD